MRKILLIFAATFCMASFANAQSITIEPEPGNGNAAVVTGIDMSNVKDYSWIAYEVYGNILASRVTTPSSTGNRWLLGHFNTRSRHVTIEVVITYLNGRKVTVTEYDIPIPPSYN